MILHMDLAERGYDILLERGALSRAASYLNLDRRVLILTDEGVPAVYAETVAKASKRAVTVRVKQGEGSKSIPVFEEVCRTLLEEGFTRSDCVVAVGGGVVGDLAGFVAASYMRGIDFYNIPTTLLSQVDSSIGGKVAVNLGGVKNIVGAFYQPKRVLIDPEVLSTLPPRQIANGMAEAVKMALTSDAELFALLEREDAMTVIDTVIERSLRIKKDVVEQDEKEAGLRKVLNFGHTLGHGIEASQGESGLYHGECVALGMLPMCADGVRERLLQVLVRLGLPTVIEGDLEEMLSLASHDKKCRGSRISTVRVEEVGSFRLADEEIEDWKAEIRSALMN
ncbi:MAG: 3-dehydroquinate synthase [Clostridia bacterium]|nr:3-dehydroquinate synthase [Clostridia bacterium]MBQ5613095.1 3-dehydroquinate synthase [Clostridia bacterium]